MLLFIITAVFYFGITSFIAQSKAPEEYSSKRNTIDELGCQTYNNNHVAQWAYKGFGIIIIAGVLYDFTSQVAELYYSVPLFFYGLFMFLAGVFSSKPFEPLVFYSIKESKKHNLLLQLAGVSLGLFVFMKFFMESGIFNRVINVLILIFMLYTSVQAGRSEERRGVYQRVMYLGCLLWLIYGVNL